MLWNEGDQKLIPINMNDRVKEINITVNDRSEDVNIQSNNYAVEHNLELKILPLRIYSEVIHTISLDVCEMDTEI